MNKSNIKQKIDEKQNIKESNLDNTHKEDINNWYCISLNPFSIKEVEWRWNN